MSSTVTFKFSSFSYCFGKTNRTTSRALISRKPFRRFKDTLAESPEELQRWFEYEQQRQRAYIKEWALQQGIEVDF